MIDEHTSIVGYCKDMGIDCENPFDYDFTWEWDDQFDYEEDPGYINNEGA
jgi:hypothetical protein